MHTLQKIKLFILSSVLISLSTFAWAKPPLVEFFTSTLCPKCPKAERYFAEKDAKNDAFILSYHIDISSGRDFEPYATKKNEARQWLYQKNIGKKYIYTPNAVVMGGKANGNAAFETSIDSLIKKGGTVEKDSGIRILPLEKTAGVRVIFPQTNTSVKDVWMVTFDKIQKKKSHAKPSNVVRTVERIGTWKGKKANYRISEFSKHAGNFVTIILQEPNSGDVIDYIVAER